MNRKILLVIVVFVFFAMSCGAVKDVQELAQELAEQATVMPVESGAEQPSQPGVEVESEASVRPTDGMAMLLIPMGEFTMGMEEWPSLKNERPEHTVYLDDYWIDKTEVTNAQYRLCVDAGVCGAPNSWQDANFNQDDQPVVGVAWDDADAYCQWVGARLPTEAEWEKAARGADKRIYSWGSTDPDGTQANLSEGDDAFAFPAPVGSFPTGVSPYGVLDMTGNAREWVVDWYQEDYYAHSPAKNPTGPESGDRGRRVTRGGSYDDSVHHSRCTDRMPQQPDFVPLQPPYTVGFRCASTTPPAE